MPRVFFMQVDWSEVVLDSGIGGKTKWHTTQLLKCSIRYSRTDCRQPNIDKNRLLSGQEQACSRIICLFGGSSQCQEWPNTQENGCWSHPRSNPFPDQGRGIIGPASLLHGWHWVLFKFNMMIILTFQGYHSWLSKKGKIQQKKYLLQLIVTSTKSQHHESVQLNNSH